MISPHSWMQVGLVTRMKLIIITALYIKVRSIETIDSYFTLSRSSLLLSIQATPSLLFCLSQQNLILSMTNPLWTIPDPKFPSFKIKKIEWI